MSDIELDVLIIGGGVQALWLLNDLNRLDYSAFMIARTPLGVGQTLHSHVYIHRGNLYTRVELAKRLRDVNDIWDKFDGITRSVRPPIFGTNLPMARYFTGMWEEAGLYFRECNAPEILQQGTLYRGKFFETGETWLDGEELMARLREPVRDLIRYGEVRRIRQNERKIQVEILIRNQRFTFQPRVLVFAAGAGNQALLTKVSSTTRAWRSQVQGIQQLRKSQMLVIKGSDLPEMTFIFPEYPIFTVCRRHGKEIVWIASFGVDEEIGSRQRIALPADPPVDLKRLQSCLWQLHAIAPKLFKMSGLQWGVYTGLKAERAEQGGRGVIPNEEVVEDFGTDNLMAIWPTKLTLAPKASARAVVVIQNRNVAPSGRFQPSSYAGTVPVGREKWKTVQWMRWPQFKSAYGLE